MGDASGLEQSCLRKSVKKKLLNAYVMLPSLTLSPFTPQTNASQLRKWTSRGGRTLPISTCAGWRKPNGEQRDYVCLVSLSHTKYLLPKQMQKGKSPFGGQGRVETASF